MAANIAHHRMNVNILVTTFGHQRIDLNALKPPEIQRLADYEVIRTGRNFGLVVMHNGS